MIEAARLVIRIDTNAKTATGSMTKLGQATRGVGQSADGLTRAFESLKAIGIAAFATTAARAVGRFTGSLIQAASDAEETANKFAVTFQGITDEAGQVATSLADGFGLAQDQAQQLLADTGDLLTGFGFTRESALDLSSQVQELAVDLASFTNFSGGAEGASAALTKALLGERESVKSLGIAITEADIDRLAEERGITGELTRQQKAMLTLELATRQSQNAIGDFARSQNSFANQTRMLQGDVRDLSVEFGQQLLPVSTELVGVARDIVGRFSELSDTAKQSIVTFASFATGTAAVTAAVIGLKVAMTTLLANPIVLGIAALAAGVGGIAMAVNNARQAGADELFETAASKLHEAAEGGEDLTDAIKEVSAETGLSVDQVISLAEEQGLVTDELREQVGILRRQAEESGQVNRNARQIARENKAMRDVLGSAAGTLGDMTETVNAYASEHGVALDRVIDQALQLDNLTDAQREQLELLEESTRENRAAEEAELSRLAAANGYASARERASAAAEAEAEDAAAAAEAEAEKTRQLEAQQRIHDSYLAARGEVLSILESEMSEIDQLRAQIDYLNEHPWSPTSQLEEDRLAAIAILMERIRELQEGGDGRAAELEEEYSQRLFEQSASRIEMLERERDERLELAEELGASTKDIEEYYANEIARLQAEQREEEERIREDELARAKQFHQDKLESEKERLEAELEAARDADEKKADAAKEAARKMEEIEKARVEATMGLVSDMFGFIGTLIDANVEDERKAAIAKKALAISEATITGAQAIIKARALDPTGILAGITAAAVAVQIGTILAQPIPAAQLGGSFVVPPGNSDDSGLLRVSSGEQVDVTPSRHEGMSMPDTIVVRIGDAAFDARVEQAFNRGSAQIRRRGAIRVNG